MLEVRQLSHSYGDRKVLDDVSFDVAAGRLTGFVGANGAGKTTAMRAILGLIRPDAGEVLVDGRPITPADRTGIGYMPEERGLYPKMRVREQIVYFGELHGVPKQVAARRADDLLERVDLHERANDKVEDLSLGNQQRAQICVALVHEPRILILDEPFSGLDPIAVEAVLEVLRERAAAGAPVLFSSHQLEVVEKLSDELVIISHGRIVAAGGRRELQEQHSRGLYRFGVDDPSALLVEPDVREAKRDADGVVVAIDASDDAAAEARAQQLLRAELDRGPVRGFARELVPLTTIFKEVR
ncbi:MAG: ABC transporter ATP-binding protein [Microbacteriaceae bacterium]|nr:ABC transporter ATP-binding protein [Microbacteriaceae bacterium]